MSIEPTCIYCGISDKARCRSIKEADDCQYYERCAVPPISQQTPAYTPKLTGGSSDYYNIPEGCTDLQDLIEHKKMSFALGNIFKAVYRQGEKDGTSQLYDAEKIVWFAQRHLEGVRRDAAGQQQGSAARA